MQYMLYMYVTVYTGTTGTHVRPHLAFSRHTELNMHFLPTTRISTAD